MKQGYTEQCRSGGKGLELFDSHAHFDDKWFDEDRDEVLSGLPAQGVRYVVNCGINVASVRASIEMAEKYDFIWAAAGIHPEDAMNAPQDLETALRPFFEHHKICAVGEIGLDYHYEFSDPAVQRDIFARQLILAGEVRKPVVIHDREAHRDVLEMVRAEREHLTGGVFHCYSGSVEMLRDVLNLGFLISLGGVVTFKNARRLVDVVSYLPMDRLMLETDSPYMSPEPWRGKRNDSAKMIRTAERIAEIKGMRVEEVVQVTTQNAKTFFGIDSERAL